MIALRTIAKNYMRLVGLDVRKSRYHFVDPFADQAHAISCLTKEPVVFDIGGHFGETIEAYRRVLPASTMHSFEPFPESFATLSRRFGDVPKVSLHQLAVSEATGQSVLYVNSNSLMNSLRAMLPDDATFGSDGRNVGEITVSTTTLDDFCGANSISVIDILKIDVEGGELRVLAGATGLLDRRAVRIIFAEVAFSPRYAQQTSFEDLFRLLTIKGFRLYGFYDIARELNGTLGWLNAVFISSEVYSSLPKNFWQRAPIR